MTDSEHKTETPNTIEWQDFEKIELRVGTVVSARVNEKAKKPAYVLEVDLGELGVKTSSAQITVHYTPEALVGRQVLCVCNFGPKRIAGVVSEVLVTGFADTDGAIVLAGVERKVPNGARLH
ncbi:tRNA-binding protein [Pandoraea commovens]|uniref:tRNA-binding protein n=1 Tax=Pandoraea commovens TaxID=2508289 RepID=A0A5E4VZ89_9BURK|nr:tRNA-binding protein [Pandoraea commovens]VVE17193.1 tRNA-binding protein [Pandoraea commovens]